MTTDFPIKGFISSSGEPSPTNSQSDATPKEPWPRMAIPIHFSGSCGHNRGFVARRWGVSSMRRVSIAMARAFCSSGVRGGGFALFGWVSEVPVEYIELNRSVNRENEEVIFVACL